MASRPVYPPTDKSVAQVLSEFKDELKDFAATRVEMLRAEMKDKLSSVTSALPALVVGAVLAAFASLLLCVAAVALVAMLLGGGAGAWAAGFGIVGGVLLFGGVGGITFGISKLKARSLKPERTLRVLRQDQAWFRNEASGNGAQQNQARSQQ